jgi:spore coat protein U-like protein
VEVRIYGRVTPGQDVTPGTYGDIVTVTVNY